MIILFYIKYITILHVMYIIEQNQMVLILYINIL